MGLNTTESTSINSTAFSSRNNCKSCGRLSHGNNSFRGSGMLEATTDARVYSNDTVYNASTADGLGIDRTIVRKAGRHYMNYLFRPRAGLLIQQRVRRSLVACSLPNFVATQTAGLKQWQSSSNSTSNSRGHRHTKPMARANDQTTWYSVPPRLGGRISGYHPNKSPNNTATAIR